MAVNQKICQFAAFSHELTFWRCKAFIQLQRYTCGLVKCTTTSTNWKCNISSRFVTVGVERQQNQWWPRCFSRETPQPHKSKPERQQTERHQHVGTVGTYSKHFSSAHFKATLRLHRSTGFGVNSFNSINSGIGFSSKLKNFWPENVVFS